MQKRKIICAVIGMTIAFTSITGCGSETVSNETSTEESVVVNMPEKETADDNLVEIGIAWRADTDFEFYTNVSSPGR